MIKRIFQRVMSVELLEAFHRSHPARYASVDSTVLQRVSGHTPPFRTDVLATLRDEANYRDLLALLDASRGLLAWRANMLTYVRSAKERIVTEVGE
ncbi:MAG: hypothetical protein WEE89_04600 [Gemmatimonadota bacterium]